MTITEALAEIKTIEKRLATKRNFVSTYLFHVDTLKDPHEKDGGSAKLVAEEEQAISDLEGRIITLRLAIQKANETNTITLEGITKSIANWLIWRREVAPSRQRYLSSLQSKLNQARDAVKRAGTNQYTYGNNPAPVSVQNIVVNIDEKKLKESAELIEKVLGDLDGQLSLKNATITVE